MKAKADPHTRTSFGRFLQKTRIENGIRLEDVARKTRIRTQILSAIEKEEHDILPAESFVKGLLRAFAKAVGADSNEVLRLYQQDLNAFNEMARLQSRLNNSKRGAWLKLTCALGLLVALATVSIYLMTFISHKMNATTVSEKKRNDLSDHKASALDSKKQAGTNTLDIQKNVPAGDPKSPVTIEKKAGHPATVNGALNSKPGKLEGGAPDEIINDTGPAIRMDGYLLSIHAVKDTWLKVIADDQEAVKYRLKTGDRLDLTAESRFNMLIGDAGGVRLILNDRPIPVNGKSGQIVNIEIP